MSPSPGDHMPAPDQQGRCPHRPLDLTFRGSEEQGRCPHRPMTAGTTLAVAFFMSGERSLSRARAYTLPHSSFSSSSSSSSSYSSSVGVAWRCFALPALDRTWPSLPEHKGTAPCALEHKRAVPRLLLFSFSLLFSLLLLYSLLLL